MESVLGGSSRIKLSKFCTEAWSNKVQNKSPCIEILGWALKNIHQWFRNASLLEDVAMVLEITPCEESKGGVMHFLEITL